MPAPLLRFDHHYPGQVGLGTNPYAAAMFDDPARSLAAGAVELVAEGEAAADLLKDAGVAGLGAARAQPVVEQQVQRLRRSLVVVGGYQRASGVDVGVRPGRRSAADRHLRHLLAALAEHVLVGRGEAVRLPNESQPVSSRPKRRDLLLSGGGSAYGPDVDAPDASRFSPS